MNTRLMSWFLCGSLLTASALAALAAAPKSPWESRLVTLEITRKQFDYFQPWVQRLDTLQKSGVVLAPDQLLTTAEYLNDQTLIRVQKGGRGLWYNAQLTWIDYHANMALLTLAEPKFWEGLEPVTLADPSPTEGAVQIVRWRNGQLEIRKGELNRLTVRRAKMSFVELLDLEIDSEIEGCGWAELAVRDTSVLGIIYAQDGNKCRALPSPFIHSVLEARQAGAYRGLGFFDFIWQKAENPDTLKHLQLPGDPRGVLVIEHATNADPEQRIRPRDIILEIAGFPIDNEGDYLDPDYGHLMLEHLARRNRWAGDTVPLTVWREGRELKVDYPLPKVDYNAELVPLAVYDQEPEYFVMGGLVFQPLIEPYLRNWGNDWRRKAPFRLVYYKQEKPKPERPSLVVLSMVLPDPYNLGYQDYRFLVVDQINGRSIARVSDLVEAFKHPQNGFHFVEFLPGEAVRRIVLDASEGEAATRRILQRYGIVKDRVLAAPATSVSPAQSTH